MDDQLVGEIRMWGLNFAPSGWLACDGRLLNVSEYQALFSILGNRFGGDGRATFALPDLRGRVAVGADGATFPVGRTGGSETVKLGVEQLPAHNHGIGVSNGPANGAEPSPGVVLGRAAENKYSTDEEPAPSGTMAPETLPPAGSNQPHANMMPFQAVGFCIAAKGVYPDRPAAEG